MFNVVGSDKCNTVYWERMIVFPCQRFQYFVLHCWQWRLYVSTREQRNSCISVVAVVRWMRHILTLYVHIAILVSNGEMYTCFSLIYIKKTHDFSTSTWKLPVLRIFYRHISCILQLTVFLSLETGVYYSPFRDWIAPILRAILWKEELEWKIWLSFQSFVYL